MQRLKYLIYWLEYMVRLIFINFWKISIDDLMQFTMILMILKDRQRE